MDYSLILTYSTDDELVYNSEEKGNTTCKAPEELSMLLDTLDGQVVIEGNPKLQDLLRRVRDGFLLDSLEEHIGQAGIRMTRKWRRWYIEGLRLVMYSPVPCFKFQ